MEVAVMSLLRVSAILLAFIQVTGCVAVPALDERRDIANELPFVRENCGAVSPNGVLIGAFNTPLSQTAGDDFTCNGKPVHRVTLEALEQGQETPRTPNQLEWVGAYLIDSILTVLAIPVVIAAVGASTNDGNISSIASNYANGQNAYGPGIHSDATGRPYTWQPTLGHTGTVLGPVKPDAYGPGVGMDATGKPVQAVPQY
jgi:hypothetical protein